MMYARPEASSQRQGKRNGSLSLGKMLLEGRAFFALIAIIAVFSFLSPYYFSVSNFLTMASHVAIFGILGMGMLLVILNGGIDLSVGSTLGLAGVIAGFLMHGVPLPFFGVVALSGGLGRRGARLRPRGARRPRQRAPRRAVQGAALRRHPRHALRGARRRAADHQRADLQQPRGPGRARQHRLRLARLQPPVRRPVGGHRHGRHRHRRLDHAQPHRLRPLALRFGRQRARGGAFRRAGEEGADHGLRAVRRLRGDRRPHPDVRADVGGSRPPAPPTS